MSYPRYAYLIEVPSVAAASTATFVTVYAVQRAAGPIEHRGQSTGSGGRSARGFNLTWFGVEGPWGSGSLRFGVKVCSFSMNPHAALRSDVFAHESSGWS